MRRLYLCLFFTLCLAACGGSSATTNELAEPYATMLDTYPSLASVRGILYEFKGLTADGEWQSHRRILNDFLAAYDPNAKEAGRQSMLSYWKNFTRYNRGVDSSYHEVPRKPGTIFLYRIAHALWAEAHGGLSWSLRDFTDEQLAMHFWEEAITLIEEKPIIPGINFDYFARGVSRFTYAKPIDGELSSVYYGWSFGKKLLAETPHATIINTVRWAKSHMGGEGIYPETTASQDAGGLEAALSKRNRASSAETITRVVQMPLIALNIPNIVFTSEAERQSFGAYTYIYLPTEKKIVHPYFLGEYPAIEAARALIPVQFVADDQPPVAYFLRHLGGSLSGVLALTKVKTYIASSGNTIHAVVPIMAITPEESAILRTEFPGYPANTNANGDVIGFRPIPLRPFAELIDPSVDIWH